MAVEMMRKSIHRRPQFCHVFVCTKQMSYMWMKNLLRTCSFSFFVDVGPEYWPDSMHEALVVAVYLPLLPCFPWTYRRSNSVLALEGILRKMSKVKDGTQGPVLRKFLNLTRKLPTLSESLVRKLLLHGRIR